MKKCPKCKSEHPDYMWFCPKCGLVLKNANLVDQIEEEGKTEDPDEQVVVPGTEDLMEKW